MLRQLARGIAVSPKSKRGQIHPNLKLKKKKYEKSAAFREDERVL